MMKLASRLDHIAPFYVLECAKEAVILADSPACDPALGGEPMIFMNIGEPDFTAAPLVQQAAAHCIAHGQTQYTQATGLPALRQRIATWYGTQFGIDISADRIVVTAGASAALQLICLTLFEPGDEVLLPDPSYPCNRHFVAAAGAKAVLLPAGADARYQLDAASVAAAWSPATRGVLLASPSNPTGTSIAFDEMAAIARTVADRGGVTLVDEIYLGLSFDEAFSHSALGIGGGLGENIVSINSFSKYFGMTGWRLGWMVLPPALVGPVERLAQNLFICPSTLAQRAALACFEPASMAEYDYRRREFRQRRDFIVPALQAMGLDVPVVPDGAFYVWFDCSRFTAGGSRGRANCVDSWDFCLELMRRAHVAVTPGRDFGPAQAERFVRLSFACSMAQVQEAARRMARVLQSWQEL